MTFKGVNAYTDNAWQGSGLAMTDKNGARTGWLGVAGNGSQKCDFWLSNDHGDVSLRPSVGGAAKVYDVPIATATPPTLYDLPLAVGWTARNISKYWKDQFGQVSLVFRIGKITPPTTQGTVGYLPVGYRPAHPVHAAATMYPAYAAAVLAIGTDGSIILFSNGSDNSAEGSFCGAVSFVAGN